MLWWGTFNHNGLRSWVGHCICQWRWRSSVRRRISDRLNAELVHNALTWWVLEYVSICLCGCLMVTMARRYVPVECVCLQLKLLNLLVPGSTSSCGKKHWEKKHQYERSTKEWKTNPHRDMKMHHLAKHLKLFLISSVLSQRVTSYNYIAW